MATAFAISASVANLVVGAMLIAIAAVWLWHSGQRINGDPKIGLGLQTLPVSTYKVWIDNKDGFADEGRYFYPFLTPFPSTAINYVSAFSISTSWVKIL